MKRRRASIPSVISATVELGKNDRTGAKSETVTLDSPPGPLFNLMRKVRAEKLQVTVWPGIRGGNWYDVTATIQGGEEVNLIVEQIGQRFELASLNVRAVQGGGFVTIYGRTTARNPKEFALAALEKRSASPVTKWTVIESATE